jgi:hypothetical protein
LIYRSKGNQNAGAQKSPQISQKMVILNRGFCTSTQSHYGYQLLPTPVFEKKPPAALENASIQPKCFQQSLVHRVLQKLLQSQKG